ncbi:diguanylate cyclase [Vibrio cholerae]
MENLSLDIRTLNFTVIVFSFIYSSGLFFYQASQKQVQGLNRLAAGIFMIGLGPLFLGFRGTAPEWLTIVLANTLIMLGFLFTVKGICAIRAYHSKGVRWLEGVLLLAGLLFVFFTYVTPSINARILILSAYLSACCFFAAWALLKGEKDDAKFPLLMMVIPFVSYGSFMVFRLAYTALGPTISSYMSSGLIHALTYLFCIILMVAISLSMLWLINARLLDSIHQLSQKDPLTGLYNRRAMDSLLPSLVRQSKEERLPLSVIMTDIDNFKRINDELGHLVGDKTIEKVAKLMQRTLPDSVLAIRFGGDEFMLLLPKHTVEEAIQQAELLRQKVALNPIVSSVHLDCTMSFGVAELKRSDSVDDLLSNADVALYEAKNGGRNQVVVAQ